MCCCCHAIHRAGTSACALLINVTFWVAKILKGDFLWEKRYIEYIRFFLKCLMFKESSWSGDAYPLAQLRVDEGQVLKRKQDSVGPFDQLDLLDSPPTKIRQDHSQLLAPSTYSWKKKYHSILSKPQQYYLMNRVRPTEPRTITRTITNAMMTYMISTPITQNNQWVNKCIEYKLLTKHTMTCIS